MNDTFVIFFDGGLLIVLTHVAPFGMLPRDVLDWYAREYAFARDRLTGYYSHSIDVSHVSYEDYHVGV